MGFSLQSAPVSLLDKLFLSLLFVCFLSQSHFAFQQEKKGAKHHLEI